MEHPVFCSISTDSFFLLHIHRAVKRCTMWFFFSPCNKSKHSPAKVYPKEYEQGANKHRVERWCCYFQGRLGLCIRGTFFSSSHALFLLYHMQFCFHIFVCLYSFTGHQQNGCQQHLARFTPVTPNAAVYLSSPSSHLFTKFGLSALLLLFPLRLMGAFPSGTPPVEWQRWPWRCCRASLL